MSPTVQTGAAAPWDAAITYVADAVVFDRGGTWQAVDGSTNSQPAIGNAHWTLIGGTPYVDLTLNAATMRSLNSTPLALLGPLGAYKIPVMVPSVGFAELITGDAFSDDIDLSVFMSDGVDRENVADGLVGLYTSKPTEHAFTFLFMETSLVNDTVLVDSSSPLSMQNATLYLESDGDVTGGDGSTLRLRIFLAEGALTTAFYAVKVVNQGAKKFTVLDNTGAAGGATGSFTIVGSTGNDGTYTLVSAVSLGTVPRAITGVNQGAQTFTVAGDRTAEFPVGPTFGATVSGSSGNDSPYTVVSAVFGAGSTVITVEQAIPDATADGTIVGLRGTVITVSEAVPDATADGWAKKDAS